MPLVSAAQLTALRTIAYRGLETPFTVWRLVRSENVYGTSEGALTQVSSGVGWLRMMNNPDLHNISSREGQLSQYRLHTTQDVDVNNGDEVRVGAFKYIVQDTNFDDTIQVYRTALLQRVG